VTSSSHFLATFGAAAASIRTFFHITYKVAISGALFTDLAAQATGAFVQLRADQDEMRRRPADLRATHHQAEVFGLSMFAAGLQTVPHGCR
jgi:hypothetical protein